VLLMFVNILEHVVFLYFAFFFFFVFLFIALYFLLFLLHFLCEEHIHGCFEILDLRQIHIGLVKMFVCHDH
jgi:hypothetical protein